MNATRLNCSNCWLCIVKPRQENLGQILFKNARKFVATSFKTYLYYSESSLILSNVIANI